MISFSFVSPALLCWHKKPNKVNTFMRLEKFEKISDIESRFFDMIRGGSAIIVVIGHIYQLLIQPNFSNNAVTHIIYSASGLAVIAFFYLSGLMITFSIYRNISSHNFNKFDVKKYASDRLWRLYPPLIMATFISVFIYIVAITLDIEIEPGVTGYLSRNGFILDDGLLASLLFIQNIFRNALPTPVMNGPLWSLSHEFWFYVLAACIASSFYLKGKIKIIPAAVFITFTAFMLYAGNTVMFFMGFGVWLLGALTALIRQNIKIKHSLVFKITSLVFLLVYFFCETSQNKLLLYYAKYIFSVSLFFYVISYFASKKPENDGLICNYLVKSSQFSYTLYVIHWPILMLIYGVFGKFMYGNALITFTICTLSFSFVIFISWLISIFAENKQCLTKTLSALF